MGEEISSELTLEVLDKLISSLPQRYISEVRINPEDYRRLREASDILKICPEQPGGFTFGMMGEKIRPESSVPVGAYSLGFRESWRLKDAKS